MTEISEICKVENEDLKKLEDKIVDYQYRFSQFLELMPNCSNPYAANELIEKSSELQLYLMAIQESGAFSKFDSLYSNNAKIQLHAQELFLKYFFDTKNHMNLIPVCNFILGKDAFQRQVDYASNFKYKERWWADLHELYFNDYELDLGDTKDIGVEEIDRNINYVDENVTKMFQSKMNIPKDFSFSKIDINSDDKTQFGEETGLNISRQDVKVYKYSRKKQLRLNLGFVFSRLSHERTHEWHNYCSDSMPKLLRGTTPNQRTMVTSPLIEGLASESEFYSIKYIKDNEIQLALIKKIPELETLRSSLTNEELKYLEETSNMKLKYGAVFGDLYQLLLLRERRENNGFDAIKEMIKITNNENLNIMQSDLFEEKEIHRVFIELSYLAGIRLLDEERERIRSVYGMEYYTQNTLMIEHGLYSGCWAWQMVPNWMDFYIENFCPKPKPILKQKEELPS